MPAASAEKDLSVSRIVIVDFDLRPAPAVIGDAKANILVAVTVDVRAFATPHFGRGERQPAIRRGSIGIFEGRNGLQRLRVVGVTTSITRAIAFG